MTESRTQLQNARYQKVLLPVKGICHLCFGVVPISQKSFGLDSRMTSSSYHIVSVGHDHKALKKFG